MGSSPAFLLVGLFSDGRLCLTTGACKFSFVDGFVMFTFVLKSYEVFGLVVACTGFDFDLSVGEISFCGSEGMSV